VARRFYIAAGFFLKGYGAGRRLSGAAVSVKAPGDRRDRRLVRAAALAPLVILSGGELVEQYRQWLSVGGTFTVMRNMSLMRVFQSHVGAVDPVVVQAIGGGDLSAAVSARFRVARPAVSSAAVVLAPDSAGRLQQFGGAANLRHRAGRLRDLVCVRAGEKPARSLADAATAAGNPADLDRSLPAIAEKRCRSLDGEGGGLPADLAAHQLGTAYDGVRS
jgi:hypothetical protein